MNAVVVFDNFLLAVVFLVNSDNGLEPTAYDTTHERILI